MKSIGIGLHLEREDVEPVAKAVAASALFVSAMDVEDDQPLSDRELLLRVAGIRAKLLERATFVAIRYGFTFRSAQEAESKISGNAAWWRQTLEENRNRVELTLKVVATDALSRPDRRDFKSGGDYMRALHAAKNAAVISDEFKTAVERHLGSLCANSRWITRDPSSIEFAGLIDRNSMESLTRAGQELKLTCPEVPFLLSAPWPLEVFADADHE